MLVAGIVTYNPNIERLDDNLKAIAPQVNRVIIVDNNSRNIHDIKNLARQYPSLIISNEENLGVAAALNQMAYKAIEIGAKWLLTIDQDTVCEDGLVSYYEEIIGQDNVASMTCRITDRNFTYEDKQEENIDSCITSGNYIELAEWEKLGGFDEKLFIDKVDTDYCYRLRQDKKIIIKVKKAGILHEVGSRTCRYSIFGKDIVVFNHIPFRVYYITRNQIYFSRKHRQSLGEACYHRYIRTAWTRILVYLIFEDEKIAKLRQWVKGLYDGYSMEIG